MPPLIDPTQNIFELPTGIRVVVRSKTDWRFGAIAKRSDERITLTVASPTGRNYRIQVTAKTKVSLNGKMPVIKADAPDDWHENLARYDRRW